MSGDADRNSVWRLDTAPGTADATLYLAGELDDARAVDLELFLRRVVDDRPTGDLTVDLAGVFSIGPRSLAALSELARELRTLTRGFVVLNPSPAVCRAVCSSWWEQGEGGDWCSTRAAVGQIDADFASSIVQQLFSVGLSLAGAQSRLLNDAARDRVAASIEGIDALVQVIRNAVFARMGLGAPSGLRVELTMPSPKEVVIRLIGDLDAEGAEYLDRVRSALDGCSIEADCSGLSSIDAASVATLSEDEAGLDRFGARIVIKGLRAGLHDALSGGQPAI